MMRHSGRHAALVLRLAAVALLIGFLAAPHAFAGLLRPLTSNGAPAIYDRASLAGLAATHLATVVVAIGAASCVAIGLAIFVTRPAGAAFLPLSRAVVNIGQTFPPVAVLALAVPVVGFGETPTRLALFLYGLLPVFESALAGLSAVSPTVQEAAAAMGLTERQRLMRVELPLALPVMLEGVRLAAVIGIATATLGSTVAAKGLGEVILAGLTTGNLAFVVQGGLVTGLLAVLTYEALGALGRLAARRTGRRTID